MVLVWKGLIWCYFEISLLTALAVAPFVEVTALLLIDAVVDEVLVDVDFVKDVDFDEETGVKAEVTFVDEEVEEVEEVEVSFVDDANVVLDADVVVETFEVVAGAIASSHLQAFHNPLAPRLAIGESDLGLCWLLESNSSNV